LPLIITSKKSSIVLIIKFKRFEYSLMKTKKIVCMKKGNIPVNGIVLLKKYSEL